MQLLKQLPMQAATQNPVFAPAPAHAEVQVALQGALHVALHSESVGKSVSETEVTRRRGSRPKLRRRCNVGSTLGSMSRNFTSPVRYPVFAFTSGSGVKSMVRVTL